MAKTGWLLSFAALAVSIPSMAQGVSYQNFSSTAGLTLNGNAAVVTTQDGKVLRLTPAVGGQSGSAFSSTPITFATAGSAFSTFFQFRITNPSASPADGLAFVLQTVSSTIGGGGGGLGYFGVSPSIAVEFDTYLNAGDPNNNHVAILANGNVSNHLSVMSPYGVTSCGAPAGVTGCLANGDLWSVWIDYDGTTMRVAVADNSTTRPADLLTYAIDVPGILNPNRTSTAPANAFAGFTAGTGLFFENQDIVDWQYANSYSPITGPGGPAPAQPLTVSGGLNLGTIPLGKPVLASLAASGGVPPYSWTLVGTAPPGITLGGSGISGTPLQPGNYAVTIQVIDSRSVGASGTITFSVMGLTSGLPAGVPFSPYVASIGVTGGSSPYTFAISGLPAGLSANSGGTILGTVTTPSTSSVSVTATDSTGVSVSASLPLTITPAPPLRAAPSILPGGTVGAVYSQSLSGATGGAPPYTWSLVSGTLPDGLSLRSSGMVSGVPSRMGSFTFGVRATDVTGASAISTAAVTIAPVSLSIATPSPLASGVATLDYPPQLILASGGTPPYAFAVTSGALPGGISLDASGALSGTPSSSGNFTFTVTATDSAGATGAAILNLPVRPLSTDLILSAGSLAFTLVTGSASLPPAQIVGTQSTVAGVSLKYTAGVTADWLSAGPASGATPGTLSVSLTSQASLLPTSDTPYRAWITVTCAACTTPSQTVAVTLLVSNPPPQLSIPADLISFTTAAGSPLPMSQTLGIANTGGGSVGIGSILCNAAWCQVSAVPGAIYAGATAPINVTADPAGLTAGYYRATLTARTSAGVAAVPVTLFIAAAQAMTLQPSGAQFVALAGGTPNGGDTDFLVGVSGASPINWTATVLPGASWLSLLNTSGSAAAAQPGTVEFVINPAAAAALAPNNYYGTIRVSSPGLVNSPQDFQVVLNIGPANGRQRPNPSPAGLLFIAQPGTAPPPQTVEVSTNAVVPVTVNASASTSDGAPWLSVAPATSTASPGAPVTSQVSVDATKLAPGLYTGGVSYAYTANGVRTVSVTLLVSGAPRPAARTVSSQPAASCTPTQMAMVPTSLVTSFSTPTAWPTPLLVQLLNDCGDPVGNGQIAATFSNGDPPIALNLADGRNGLYAGTWTPRRTSSQVSITTRAAAPGFAPVTALLAGAVTPNSAPLLARNSTLHAFNPLPAAALAPGTLVQISGTALAAQTSSAGATPLPTMLNGTQVVIGGIPAPISSVSPGVLGAQIPFELTPGMQYQVVVSANGAITTPDTIQLANTSPGVATAAGDLVSAFHSDGSAVTETSPATPGETITLLSAGLGLTDTPVGSGAAAPASPAANALSAPTLTINGTPAVISFAGLQPGMVGVYQVTFTVPADAKSGDLTLVLTQEGQPGNAATLPVK